MKALFIPAFALAALSMAGCATKAEAPARDWTQALQSAETPEGHEQLATHYAEVAQTMQASADEERRMLAEYQRRPDRYGKQVLDLRARSQVLIRDFEKTADDSRQLSDFHRQRALELR